VRGLLDLVIALPFAALPKRYWQSFDLPIPNVAAASSMLTLLLGAALGITGYFAHMKDVLAAREFTAPPFMLAVFLGYVLFSPRGLFSLYLVISGLLRAAASSTGEPFGDPMLTGIDTLARRMSTTHEHRSIAVARRKLEKIDEPDRRYDGEWAGLTGVDFVIVAARRKPGWTKGTWVITEDGWFVLGEPFDRPLPNGLRTVYPLTAQTTLEAVRKSVNYQLPPLRSASAATGRSGETSPKLDGIAASEGGASKTPKL
jgi:hypothetical protein